MIDPEISGFFSERKEAFLKKKLKSSMTEEEVYAVKQECDDVFAMEQWLPNAAKRAGQISMATHPCTFSHPSARKNKNGYVTSIIEKAELRKDGFLKSGNASVDIDALGNAAALDVHKFLTLEMYDGQKLLAHIQGDTALAKDLLTIETLEYKDLKDGFLAMAESDDEVVTSSKIKQVYFPVGEGYHQLSLLTNSGLVYEMRARIDNVRFSEKSKELRDLKRKNEASNIGFSDAPQIATIGYGGTKPQNISVLNNKNGGKAHLLFSLPPQIQKRTIHFPKRNFFGDTFRVYECREIFHALHNLLKTDYTNVNIREGRDYRLQETIDRIINKMWAVRSVCNEQYHEGTSRLSRHQKIWLCDEFSTEREESDEWLEKLMDDIADWIVRSYEKTFTKPAVKFSANDKKKITEIISNNKEALR